MGILKNNAVVLSAISLVLALSGCQELDLQGRDPQEYYAAHPIANKVETRHALFVAEFEGSSKKLSPLHYNVLAEKILGINPHAVEAVTVRTPVGIAYKNQRVSAVRSLLSNAGLNSVTLTHGEVDADTNEILIDVTYADVVLPDCPDWKKSPVTTYSNMLPANFGCAATNNLGLMVDNPRDLVRGRESNRNYSERGSKAISDYRNGVVPAAPATSASSPIGQ